MKITFSNIVFCAEPKNYNIIDNYVSRSAQPTKEDLIWLKDKGITDIFNFRTMIKPEIMFDERKEVENLGMNYHHIPSITSKPSEKNIEKFFKEIQEIIKNGGKAHIHCMAGADRTGMYSFLYKIFNGIGTVEENRAEWLAMGHDRNRYPHLIEWTENLIKSLKLHK